MEFESAQHWLAVWNLFRRISGLLRQSKMCPSLARSLELSTLPPFPLPRLFGSIGRLMSFDSPLSQEVFLKCLRICICTAGMLIKAEAIRKASSAFNGAVLVTYRGNFVHGLARIGRVLNRLAQLCGN